VARARRGAEDAYFELVRRYERPLYSLVARMVRDAALAEDLAQEIFVKAFRSLEAYDPQRKFSSWLFKIAHNATIDHLRRRGLETQPLEETGDEGEEAGLLRTLADPGAVSPAQRHERFEMAQALEAAMRRLRPEYREIVVLRFQEGLAYEEIAEATSLPLGTVKTHIHRARKELAEILGSLGYHPPSETRRASEP
jgi:RNA polymerase sigma-70 factor (ECF subfamily)